MKREKTTRSISASCEMVSYGKSIASCPEDLRAERWLSSLRQPPEKAHPFRSVRRFPLAPPSQILIPSEQLFYCPKDTAAPPRAPAKSTFTFVAVPQSELALAGQGEDAVTILEDTFLAASENGFILSREDEMAWTCITPGAQARLAW